MTHHHPIDIDDVLAGEDERWIVAALTDQLVAMTHHQPGLSGDDRPRRFDLTADEAHELGTKLRRMARKARGDVIASR